MLRKTILTLALACVLPVTQALPLPAPLPSKSVQHAEQLMANWQLEDATKSIKALIKKDPGNARMHYYLAQIHAANGQWMDARAMLMKAKYFDWRLKFASSKQRVADFELLIEEKTKKTNQNARSTQQYDEWKRSEKRSYMATFSSATTPEQTINVKKHQKKTFLWFFLSAVGLIGVGLIYGVCHFNIQNKRRTIRLAEAAIKEQKIVLSDLIRVLNDVEAITKSENLNNLHNDIVFLLKRIYALMAKLETNELQSIEDIEQYVRDTQLYRHHCNNLQDLPAVASN